MLKIECHSDCDRYDRFRVIPLPLLRLNPAQRSVWLGQGVCRFRWLYGTGFGDPVLVRFEKNRAVRKDRFHSGAIGGLVTAGFAYLRSDSRYAELLKKMRL